MNSAVLPHVLEYSKHSLKAPNRPRCDYPLNTPRSPCPLYPSILYPMHTSRYCHRVYHQRHHGRDHQRRFRGRSGGLGGRL